MLRPRVARAGFDQVLRRGGVKEKALLRFRSSPWITSSNVPHWCAPVKRQSLLISPQCLRWSSSQADAYSRAEHYTHSSRIRFTSESRTRQQVREAGTKRTPGNGETEVHGGGDHDGVAAVEASMANVKETPRACRESSIEADARGPLASVFDAIHTTGIFHCLERCRSIRHRPTAQMYWRIGRCLGSYSGRSS